MAFLGVASIGIFPYLYPNGRFVPQWTKWLAAGWIVLQFPILFFPDSLFNMEHWPPWIGLALNLTLFSTMIAAQVYCYRHVSSKLQRQQTKWLLFSFALPIAVLMALSLVAP